MSNQDGERGFSDVGERLSLVRRLLDLSQADLAARLNWSTTRWNNWELGIALIPPPELRRLKAIVPGLTSDWIYDGEPKGLTVDLLERLNSLPLGENGSSPKKRGRPRKA